MFSLPKTLIALVATALVSVGSVSATVGFHRNEFVEMPGHTQKESVVSPLPHTYVNLQDIPTDFDWSNVNGTSFLTKNLNQHLPQYCGSCWAHGSMSSLADRIKIARKAQGVDINLAIQFILNCGTKIGGSCYGGSATGAFEFVQKNGFIPYDTANPYLACSYDSSEGACKYSDWSCNALNTARTCSTFSSNGGFCAGLDYFPNATIAEYGTVVGESKIMAEVYARGPIAAGVNAEPILDYTGGVIPQTKFSKQVNHIVSITGWGTDMNQPAGQQDYWIVRNSWGEYWGEMGFFRISRGTNNLGIEDNCAWATPGTFTEHNTPCYEDGTNCVATTKYVDPSALLN